MTKTLRSVGIALSAALLAPALVPVAANADKGRVGTQNCSIAPNPVVLDQVWTVSASGLPTGSTVNRIITFPDGAQAIGRITVGSNGTFTTTGNSDMSATWGFIAPEQLGTYTYQFVGRIKWPAGTFTQSYARCSVTVS
jgi:hypothetical protein